MKSVHIKGYKRLEDVKLEELGKVNYLVGGNSSGKSSVLECLKLFSDGLSRTPVHKKFKSDGFSKHAVGGGSLHIELTQNDRLPVGVSIEYAEISPNGEINHGANSFYIKNSSGIQVAIGSNSDLARRDVIPRRSIGGDYGFSIQASYIATKPAQGNPHAILPIYAHLDKDSINETTKDIILDFLNAHHPQRSTGAKFVDIHKAIQGDEAILLKLAKVGSNEDGEFHYLDGTTTYPIMSLSGGMHSLLDFYYGIEATLRDSALNKGVTRVICIEEPETGLHPDNQKKVAHILDELSDKHGDVVFFVTTHSPFIISAAAQKTDKSTKIYLFDEGSLVAPDGSRVTSDTGQCGTKCLNVVAKMLGAGFDDLNGVPKTSESLTVVYCEGENDKKKDSRLYRLIFQDQNVVFVSASDFRGTVIAFRIGEQAGKFVFGDNTVVRALIDRSNGCRPCSHDENTSHETHDQGFSINAFTQIKYTHKKHLTFDDDEVAKIEKTEPSGRLRVLKRKELENYLFAPEVVQKLAPALAKQLIIPEKLDYERGEVKDLINGKSPKIMEALARLIYEHRDTETKPIYNELAELVGLPTI